MQGRLSAQVGGRVQAFPGPTWKNEFHLAADLGLACVEWIYENDGADQNPISTPAGVAQIRAVQATSGVAVLSVCADYFMQDRLVTHDAKPGESAVRRAHWLLSRANEIGARHIVLPFVDAASLKTPQEVETLVGVLQALAPAATAAAVEMHIETDLEPSAVAEIIERIGAGSVRVTLDTGNSASFGFEASSEMDHLAILVGSVHVKDRVRRGATVPLGEGDADLPTYVRRLTAAGFRGPYILQVARSQDGDEAGWAKHNRDYVARLLDEGMLANTT